MDVAELVLDYLRVLAWPAVLLVLVGWRFYAPIRALIGRVTGMKGPAGLELSSPLPQSTAGEKPEGVPPSPIESPDASTRVQDLLLRQAQPSGDVEEGLLQAYQIVNWQLFYERSYSWIYGTQLGLLQAANTSASGLGRIIVSFWHQQHLQRMRAYIPNYDIPFEHYVAPLINVGLLSHMGNSPQDVYTITPAGRGFLVYLTTFGKPFSKPY